VAYRVGDVGVAFVGGGEAVLMAGINFTDPTLVRKSFSKGYGGRTK